MNGVKMGLGMVLVLGLGLSACGGEIGAFADQDKIDQAIIDHRPVCGAIGSRSEGWYWSDTNELIKYEFCGSMLAPECSAIGTRSEGWYSSNGLIAYDSCHLAVGIGLAGESCGPSIGVSCYTSLYCAGLPADVRGGSGTCMVMAGCLTLTDCFNPENVFPHVACEGYMGCEDLVCKWHCGPSPREGVWSWTTVLLPGIESAHPYTNNLNKNWTVTSDGATRMKLHFSKIDTEKGFDFLSIKDVYGVVAATLTGLKTDYWTPEVNGASVIVNLKTDYSVTKWGFQADQVSFYEQLAPYLCNRNEDCLAGETCVPHQCFNAYAPCYGDCVVVDASGNQGDPCDADRPCNEGLWCKQVIDGAGTCQGELWCQTGTEFEDCANVLHTADLGSWTCESNLCTWVPDGQPMERTFVSSDTPLGIPDYSTTGAVAELDVDEVFSCTLSVWVNVTIRHTYSGDLVVGLTDPTGNRILLRNRVGGSADNIVLVEAPITGLPKDRANGIWKLDVSDRARADIGTLDHFSLHLKCQ